MKKVLLRLDDADYEALSLCSAAQRWSMSDLLRQGLTIRLALTPDAVPAALEAARRKTSPSHGVQSSWDDLLKDEN
jgi:hypothetical protein